MTDRKPIGTMTIVVEANRWATRPEMAWRATHAERFHRRTRHTDFYGATWRQACDKAEEYDEQRKAVHAKAKVKRQKVKV